MTQSAERLLTVLLVLPLVAAAAGAAPGLYMAWSDLETSGEFLDGLGAVVGLAIVGLVAVPAVVAVVALRAIGRRTASARRWAVAAGVLGMAAAVPFGFYYQPLLAVLVVPLLLVVVAFLDLVEA